MQRHSEDLTLQVPEREVDSRERAEHQPLSADAPEDGEEIAPDYLSVEGVATLQAWQHVLQDQRAGGRSTHLVVGYADTLQPLVGLYADNSHANRFDLARRIGQP